MLRMLKYTFSCEETQAAVVIPTLCCTVKQLIKIGWWQIKSVIHRNSKPLFAELQRSHSGSVSDFFVSIVLLLRSLYPLTVLALLNIFGASIGNNWAELSLCTSWKLIIKTQRSDPNRLNVYLADYHCLCEVNCWQHYSSTNMVPQLYLNHTCTSNVESVCQTLPLKHV